MDKRKRLSVYLDALQPDMPDYLSKIEKRAVDCDVPIIRRESRYFMKTLLWIIRPGRILEIGTAVAFSALFFMNYAPGPCHIDTIESYEPRIREAKANIENSPFSKDITLYEGDAMKILPGLSGTYDLIFLDAAKGQYVKMLPLIKKLMHSGSVLVTDNILQEGDLIESTFAVKRRNRTIHKRIRKYLEEVSFDESFVTTTIDEGDGMCISVMK